MVQPGQCDQQCALAVIEAVAFRGLLGASRLDERVGENGFRLRTAAQFDEQFSQRHRRGPGSKKAAGPARAAGSGSRRRDAVVNPFGPAKQLAEAREFDSQFTALFGVLRPSKVSSRRVVGPEDFANFLNAFFNLISGQQRLVKMRTDGGALSWVQIVASRLSARQRQHFVRLTRFGSESDVLIPKRQVRFLREEFVEEIEKLPGISSPLQSRQGVIRETDRFFLAQILRQLGGLLGALADDQAQQVIRPGL